MSQQLKSYAALISFFLFFSSFLTFGQDMLIRRSGDTINCLIKKVDNFDYYILVNRDGKYVKTTIRKSDIVAFEYNRFKDRSPYIMRKYAFCELSVGSSVMTTKDVFGDNKAGSAGQLGIRFFSRNFGFSFMPNIQYKYYSVKADEPNEDDVLRLPFYNFSTQFSFRLYEDKSSTFAITNFIEPGFSIIQHNYVHTYEEHDFLTRHGDTKTEKFEIFAGKAGNLRYGYRFNYQNIFFELAYNMQKCKVALNEDVVSYDVKNQEGYTPEPKLDFSSVDFKIGISISAGGF